MMNLQPNWLERQIESTKAEIATWPPAWTQLTPDETRRLTKITYEAARARRQEQRKMDAAEVADDDALQRFCRDSVLPALRSMGSAGRYGQYHCPRIAAQLEELLK